MGHIATDAELVTASLQGEREAFGALVSRYQDVVCAVSYSSTGDWNLSQDVTQETFIAAWSQLGQLRETSRLRSWLCGIARNLARKARRRGDREVALDDTLPAVAANPFDVTAQAEVDRVVREALARIPETYREVLVLYYCEQRSVRDVATTLGIAETAAMQRLTRGRRYLADGVTELVERALRGPRTKKNLVAGVLAALPVAMPSRVDASPTPEGSTMFKLAIAGAVLVVGSTAAVVAHTYASDDDAPAAHTAPPVAAAATAPAPAPAPKSGAAPAAQKPGTTPTLGAQPGDYQVSDDGEPISRARLRELKLDVGPSRGPADAPVTIIVFTDMMCTYCSKVIGTIDDIWDEYPGKLRLVVKQFPVHDEAKLAGEAALAADAQGKFWQLHDVMLANQNDLSRDALVRYAKQAGLDDVAFARALDAHTYGKALADDMAAGMEIGIRATPSFLINGQEMTGARPIEFFRAEIDEALSYP